MTQAPFISRTFELDGEPVIEVRWFQPASTNYNDGMSEAVRCDWELVWPDRIQRRYSVGIDSVQALTLAMRAVHWELSGSDEGKAARITRFGEHDLDLPTLEELSANLDDWRAKNPPPE